MKISGFLYYKNLIPKWKFLGLWNKVNLVYINLIFTDMCNVTHTSDLMK